MGGGRLDGLRRAAAAVLLGLAAAAHGQARTPSAAADVVAHALALLGTPYRYGGDHPATGFDCSGLVRHVYGAALGREMPRRAEDLGAFGRPVSRAELQPGDLIFFNTLRRAFSHVAIYIGDGRFVHAPAGRGRVRIEGLDDRYWAVRFDGARRLLESSQVQTAPPALAPPWGTGERPPEP
jgi:cell wall-associated NlpC family hydrolase